MLHYYREPDDRTNTLEQQQQQQQQQLLSWAQHGQGWSLFGSSNHRIPILFARKVQHSFKVHTYKNWINLPIYYHLFLAVRHVCCLFIRPLLTETQFENQDIVVLLRNE